MAKNLKIMVKLINKTTFLITKDNNYKQNKINKYKIVIDINKI